MFLTRILAAAIGIAAITQSMPASAAQPQASQSSTAHPWWQDAVVYQVYPRSFADSNGDGIGDLNGITAHLDYLKKLGVTVVWLSPHFDSPNVDNGYDIRDYRKVMAEFGTMADFDRMLAGMRARGIRLVIDLVVNHTSDQHAWFRDAVTGPGATHRDDYIWRPGKADGLPPNNATAFFGGSAWTKAGPGGDYYLHYFAPQQPDLNWDNPKVRQNVYDIMRFWLDKGVSGFRMDVIPLISKDQAFPDLTAAQLADTAATYAHGPHTHDYLREMNREVLSHYDTMTVGEAIGISDAEDAKFTAADRHELNMIFHFDASNVDRDGWRTKPWALPDLKAIYDRLYGALGKDGWTATFLTNHDKPRAVSHFGDDAPRWRVASAKALATMSLMQRGTPFIYQGDELGMTNYPFTAIDQYNDISAKNLWHEQVEEGHVAPAEMLAALAKTSRDNSRTPMQWTAGKGAGFTQGVPWLAINPNHVTINAQAEESDAGSVLSYYRQLIALRARMPVLVSGDYQDIDPDNRDIYAFTRKNGDDRLVVLINFSEHVVDYALPSTLRLKERLIDSVGAASAMAGAGYVALQPWQAAVYHYEGQ